MDLETVRDCFQKYISYFETNEKVKVPSNLSIKEMTITEIDKVTQTMFMNYVMNSSQKISPVAIPCVLYKHMNSLIRQYVAEENSKPLIKVIMPEPVPTVTLETKSKGWLW